MTMPKHVEHKTDRWPVILLRSAKLALTYERTHAPHPAHALRAFIKGQKALLARLFRLGLGQHIKLIQLELECARAGLGYPRTDASGDPPWCLPEEFTALPTEALPYHPLIDSLWLSELVSERPGARLGALPALHELVSSEGLSTRWTGVPRIGHADFPIPGNARVAVCLHLYYPEMWPMLSVALEAIPEPWDLYVSVPDFACTPTFARIAREHPAVRFLPCANRGRDVLPFLRWLEIGVFDRYDVVCKLHSKRSPHMQDGASWLAQVLQSLLGEREVVAELLARIRGTHNIGMLGPQALQIDSDHPMHRGGNRRILEALATRALLPPATLETPFFAGTMFWFRPAALVGLRAMAFQEENFPIEMAQTDGTPAHALERLIWPLVEQAGFKVCLT
jgi:rhamnosyltransferase